MLVSEIIIEKETQKSITISKESWQRIKNEVLKTEKSFTKQDLKKYIGKIKLSQDPLEYQKKIRNEW